MTDGAGAGVDPKEPTPEIDDYILSHRDEFTPKVITDFLVHAGHDRSAVENAWARLGPGTRARGSSGCLLIGCVTMVAVGLLVFGGCLAALTAVAAADAYGLLFLLGRAP